MNNQNVETVTTKSDVILVTLAVLSALAGVIAFALLTEQPLSVRLGVLAGGLVLAVLLAWLSPSGKRLLAYGRQSYEELRRVVWPTKKETLNTTGMVMAFVIVMAFFLFLVDKIIEWGLYDVLLRLSI
ncbi:MAG: preprotein translocase subunit SecE [Sutterella parvirubra]|uniref:Protein translocase subunit SecE n=1 Tax=Sutterella parvirubra YIT 11816 TaxID=762967 RepID=H3KBT2_9BURK|nr:preprotein translocase subunit SecE [Sutterella parvirubra]EHY32419.1 preprotein translocase, SecE subunit [Sutterella parvirubra YIT 11816]MDY5201295.1 preprotein translocase subunit SecE [Sutterella parvirubra]